MIRRRLGRASKSTENRLWMGLPTWQWPKTYSQGNKRSGSKRNILRSWSGLAHRKFVEGAEASSCDSLGTLRIWRGSAKRSGLKSLPRSELQFCRRKHIWWMASLVRVDRKAKVIQKQLWWAEKHLRMHNTLNLEADGLQQQKTMSGSTYVSQEHKTEAAVGTGSPKLDSWRLEKQSLVWWISISADAYRWSEFDTNSMNPWTKPTLCQQSRLVAVVS